MSCPVCKTGTLSEVELESMLNALKCSECGGYWVKGAQYWQWLKDHGDPLPEKPAEFTADLPVADSKEVKVCIECGRLMIRYKVGHDVPFRLDRCSACGGIWLDRNEWEILKSRNLHDEIHVIFTAAWQSDNRRRELEANYEKEMAEILGAKDYDDLKRLKSWLHGHPQKAMIIGYLMQSPQKA